MFSQSPGYWDSDAVIRNMHARYIQYIQLNPNRYLIFSLPVPAAAAPTKYVLLQAFCIKMGGNCFVITWHVELFLINLQRRGLWVEMWPEEAGRFFSVHLCCGHIEHCSAQMVLVPTTCIVCGSWVLDTCPYKAVSKRTPSLRMQGFPLREGGGGVLIMLCIILCSELRVEIHSSDTKSILEKPELRFLSRDV